jgi:hypothetical protein
LRLTQHDRLHGAVFGSMIPYVLQTYLDFRVRQHVLHAHDANRNDAEAVRYAEAYAVEIVPHMAQRRLLGGGAGSWNQHYAGGGGGGDGRSRTTFGSLGSGRNQSMNSHASTIARGAGGSGVAEQHRTRGTYSDAGMSAADARSVGRTSSGFASPTSAAARPTWGRR